MASATCELSGTRAVLRIGGDLDVTTVPQLYRQLYRLCRKRAVQHVELDLGAVDELSTAGIAMLTSVRPAFERTGKTLTVSNLRSRHRRALELTRRPAPRPAAGPPPEGFAQAFVLRLGDRGFGFGAKLARLAALVTDAARSGVLVLARRRRLPRGAIVEQCVRLGVDALPIVLLLSGLLGLILAFQGAYQLRRFGANIYVADLVGVAMAREFAPMLTAVILSGRSGAAIAAELSAMRIQEEVDALRTMGVDPVRFLVLPRLAALTLMQPLLTLMAGFVGVGGGLIIGVSYLDLSAIGYLQRTAETVTTFDVVNGLGKSVLFAWIIGVTACFTGMSASGGATSVGRATTRAVVASIFFIIVTDSIVAIVTTLVQGPPI